MFFDFVFGRFSRDLAIDLGTANTLVFVKGKLLTVFELTFQPLTWKKTPFQLNEVLPKEVLDEFRMEALEKEYQAVSELRKRVDNLLTEDYSLAQNKWFPSTWNWNMKVIVKDNRIEKAIRDLKKKLLREGFFSEIRDRRFYDKPSVKRKKKQAKAQKRRRKAMTGFKPH